MINHTQKIQVLIVDDHPIVLRGLYALFHEIEDIEVVGLANNGKEALVINKDLQPDVILLDLLMPEMDGIEAIKEILTDTPKARILILSSFLIDDRIFQAIKAGALGYVLKDSNLDELVNAIRQVYRYEPYISPIVAQKIFADLQKKGKDEGDLSQTLTNQELKVFKLLARGKENQEIAEKLVVAEVTVRTHISRILQKLHLKNRVQASLYALRHGISSLDDEK